MLHLDTQKITEGTKSKLTDFFTKVSRAASRSLILDYDGTLAPFSADRQRVLPYPAVPGLLEQIRTSTNTRVVIVSGRRASEVATLLGLRKIEVWGCHGLSRLHADGRYDLPNLDEESVGKISEINALLIQQGLFDLLEFKPASTAVHWRGIEDAADQVARRVQTAWWMLADRRGLELLTFDGGMEIRVAGRNKGDAVRTILGEMGGRPAVAYLGDDQTDEAAFAALQGYGLSVLVRHSYRPTIADVWIQPNGGVITFLSDWAAACGVAP